MKVIHLDNRHVVSRNFKSFETYSFFLCVSKVEYFFSFFFFQDIDPDDENMQLFLSMGVEINGVVKKVSFITLSNEKVILLIKKSDSLRIFLFRYKNVVVFFAQEDMPYDR